MKKEGRVALYCWKKLLCGVIDSFRIVVSEEAKAKYKSMGYEVK